jgi:hypothetical protein
MTPCRLSFMLAALHLSPARPTIKMHCTIPLTSLPLRNISVISYKILIYICTAVRTRKRAIVNLLHAMDNVQQSISIVRFVF